MKIAILSDLWVSFPGGAERYVFNLARELKRRGHEIHVLTSYIKAVEFDGIKPVWKSVGCHAYDSNPGHTHADGWRDIVTFLNETSPDVILTHQFFSNEFREELYGGAIPVIQIVHNGLRNPRAALAIYNSNYTRVRANPKDSDLTILPPAYSDCVSERHDDFIGFIKPIPHKGVDFFYQIASQMQDKNFLVLRGEWQDCEDIRRGLPNVFFMEPVHEIKTFYERCRLILMPSLQEDAGTVAQEAALNGLPCISSDVMGLPETNAGFKLPHSLLKWISHIRRLDDSQNYEYAVLDQKSGLARMILDWEQQFNLMSQKIEEMGSARK